MAPALGIRLQASSLDVSTTRSVDSSKRTKIPKPSLVHVMSCYKNQTSHLVTVPSAMPATEIKRPRTVLQTIDEKVEARAIQPMDWIARQKVALTTLEEKLNTYNDTEEIVDTLSEAATPPAEPVDEDIPMSPTLVPLDDMPPGSLKHKRDTSSSDEGDVDDKHISKKVEIQGEEKEEQWKDQR
ncbi:hypothetical protein PMZ80_007670 [Knufia obscura]|uniref:Uncharacterized protein n=1 Tax=Knufia obscura TaxID=1635080 RepID=A0ABR0RIZ1_9EURO|nr:hypothetical protein PMZ80_007670 [Knufia obscura]